MKKKILSAFLALSLSGMVPAIAQEARFDPAASCTLTLKNYADGTSVWASGYLSAIEGSLRVVTWAALDALNEELLATCKLAPHTAFVTIVEQLAAGADSSGMDSPDPLTAGAMPLNVPEIARPLVEKFLAPDLDLAEILRSLRPTPDEIALLYPEEMVRKLDAIYEDMFGERLDREEFPAGPVEIEVGFTTTFELEQAPFVDELPGGFRRVKELFQVDVPFGYINVIFSQVQDNLKLSGFVYVNDRWVLMLRPWRALD